MIFTPQDFEDINVELKDAVGLITHTKDIAADIANKKLDAFFLQAKMNILEGILTRIEQDTRELLPAINKLAKEALEEFK